MNILQQLTNHLQQKITLPYRLEIVELKNQYHSCREFYNNAQQEIKDLQVVIHNQLNTITICEEMVAEKNEIISNIQVNYNNLKKQNALLIAELVELNPAVTTEPLTEIPTVIFTNEFQVIDMQSLRSKIKAARLAIKGSQKNIAHSLAISQSTYNAFENYPVKFSMEKYIVKFAAITNTEVSSYFSI